MQMGVRQASGAAASLARDQVVVQKGVRQASGAAASLAGSQVVEAIHNLQSALPSDEEWREAAEKDADALGSFVKRLMLMI